MHRIALTVLVLMSFTVQRLPAAEDGGREAAQIATAKEQEAVVAADPPDKVYDIFNRFCIAQFGAEVEPLVREVFGAELKQYEDGTWVHASETSAVVAFQSNLPARSRVAFGPTPAFGQLSDVRERPFSIHIHHLTGLEPGKTYHWRAEYEDEAGTKTQGPAATFTTRQTLAFAPFPGNRPGPPYIIDQPGDYLLTQDVTAPRTAIEIRVGGVTLDLGGHTVTYATEVLPDGHFTDKWASYDKTGSFGIKVNKAQGVRLLNGRIIQGWTGPGKNRGNDESTGFNALYLREVSEIELAGLEIDYNSAQNCGVRFRDTGDRRLVHHNLLRDRGTMIHNRHGSGSAAIDALGTNGADYLVHHNLLARTRQNGLRGSPERIFSNEIYVDSWATNSFGLSVKTGGELHHNRLFATGYHAIAVPWGDGIKAHDNFIHMQGINTGKTRWWEGFGDQNSMNGLRHTQWGTNKTPSTDSLYERNTVCIYGRNGAQIRGVEFFSDPYIKGLTLRGSLIKVISQDAETSKVSCVATHGLPAREAEQLPVTYQDCTFISNANLIRLGDDYGKGSHHHFSRCRFVRVGEDPRFHTFVAMGTHVSRFHRFIDSVFAPGTAADDVDWTGTKPGSRDYAIEWTLTVHGKPGEVVVVRDAAGVEAFRGAIAAEGSIAMPLRQFRMSHAGKEVSTPHTVEIGDRSQQVVMDGSKEVR